MSSYSVGAIVEAFPGLVSIVDAQGRIIHCNGAALEAVGRDLDGVRGCDFASVFFGGAAGDGRDDPGDPLYDTLIGGKECAEARMWLTLNGRRGYFLVTARLLREGSGPATGACVVLYDQTEQELAWDYARELVERQVEVLQASQAITVDGLALLAEHRDPTIGGHLYRIRRNSRIIAERMSCMSQFAGEVDEVFVSYIELSSVLHDLGKVGIPEGILLKPGKLTPAEFTVMREHTSIGAALLEQLDNQLRAVLGADYTFLTMARDIAMHHHERWDGQGYPAGLRGDQIPLAARIVAVADVYDALISPRVYKGPVTPEEARQVIVAGAGTQFDPHIVQAFLDVESELVKHGEEPTVPDPCSHPGGIVIPAADLLTLPPSANGMEPSLLMRRCRVCGRPQRAEPERGGDGAGRTTRVWPRA